MKAGPITNNGGYELKKWKWTDHVILQMKEREIRRAYVEETLNNSDEIVDGKNDRKVYRKVFGRRLLRVIIEEDKVITAYFTTKIAKYLSGGESN